MTMPTSLGIKPGTMLTVPISVMRNGLSGSVSLTFTGLPTGVTCTTPTLGADAGSVDVVLTAAGTAPSGLFTINLQANGVTYETVSLAVYGASATVDSSFQGGYVIDSAAGSGTIFNAVTLDAAGHVVAGGTKGSGGWVLRRFASDGTADSAFDTAVAAAMPTSGALNGLAYDPATDNIIAVGDVSAGNTELAVAVVNTSGNLAGTFNSGSLFNLTSAEADMSSASGVVVAAPGTFMFAGSNSAEAMLAGPMSESSMPNWGTMPVYESTNAKNVSFAALAKDANGKFVAAGSAQTGPPSVLLQRFSGITIDGAFNPTNTASATSPAESLAIRPSSGDIFVAGSDINVDEGGWGQWAPGGANQWFNHQGNGGGGPFHWPGATPMPGDTMDRIYVVGSGGDSYGWSSYIVRALPGGGIDSSFGGANGIQTSDTGSPPTFKYILKAVAVQPDGLVVVAGEKIATADYPFVARYWP